MTIEIEFTPKLFELVHDFDAIEYVRVHEPVDETMCIEFSTVCLRGVRQHGVLIPAALNAFIGEEDILKIRRCQLTIGQIRSAHMLVALYDENCEFIIDQSRSLPVTCERSWQFDTKGEVEEINVGGRNHWPDGNLSLEIHACGPVRVSFDYEDVIPVGDPRKMRQ